MKLTPQKIEQLKRKVAREDEMENGGRVSHNRVHASKKAYSRKNAKIRDSTIWNS